MLNKNLIVLIVNNKYYLKGKKDIGKNQNNANLKRILYLILLHPLKFKILYLNLNKKLKKIHPNLLNKSFMIIK